MMLKKMEKEALLSNSVLYIGDKIPSYVSFNGLEGEQKLNSNTQ